MCHSRARNLSEGFSTLTDRSSCPDNPEPGTEGRVERSFD